MSSELYRKLMLELTKFAPGKFKQEGVKMVARGKEGFIEVWEPGVGDHLSRAADAPDSIQVDIYHPSDAFREPEVEVKDRELIRSVRSALKGLKFGFKEKSQPHLYLADDDEKYWVETFVASSR